MTRERERGSSTPKGKRGNAFENGELGKTLGDIKKRMGDHVVSTGIAAAGVNSVETGIFTVDYALLGGIPESRVSMIYGHPAAGKSTTAARIAAAAQRKNPDKVAVWIDAEGTFDKVWGQAAGIDMDRFILIQPETAEDAVDITEAMIRAKETCNVTVDSLPALVPNKIIERSAEDPTMALRAQLIGICCSKTLAALQSERGRQHHPSVILINQWRSKVGFVLGNPNTLPGGSQPRYVSSVMLEIKKKKEHTGKDRFGNDTAIYNEHAFDVDKSKCGSSIRQGEFKLVTSSEYNMSVADQKDGPDVMLPAGAVDDYKVVATYAKRMGVITGSGGGGFEIDGVNSKFRSIKEITKFLVEEPKSFVVLKRKLISLKRTENGLPALPPDKYLLGKVK